MTALDAAIVELVARGVALGLGRTGHTEAPAADDRPVAVSVAEAARRLGISPDLVRDMLDTGALPELRWGQRRTVPVRAIEAAVDRAMAGWHPDEIAKHLQVAS